MTRMSHPQRLTMLVGGLFVFAFALVLSLRCGLGTSSWNVLADGMSIHTPLSIGMASQLVGIVMLGIAWLFGVRPGFGTVANMLLIGFFLDLILWTDVIPEATTWPMKIIFLVASIVILGLASAVYIKAGYGAGPRDSFMLAMYRRTGLRIGYVRWGMEVAAVGLGILLGGDFGVGTIIAAVTLGFVIDYFFRLLNVQVPKRAEKPSLAASRR